MGALFTYDDTLYKEGFKKLLIFYGSQNNIIDFVQLICHPIIW